MRKIDQIESSVINGGGFASSFCTAFGVGASAYGVYAAGVALNWWNPIGWVGGGALAAGAVVGLGCAVYAVSTQ